jgi:hypothetical protein
VRGKWVKSHGYFYALQLGGRATKVSDPAAIRILYLAAHAPRIEREQAITQGA